MFNCIDQGIWRYGINCVEWKRGTMEYVKGSRKGMLFRPHDWNMIDELLYDCNIIYRGEKVNRERVVILKKG